MRRDRTMSVSPPPQVELIRPETGEDVVGDLVNAATRHDAAQLHLLGERHDVGGQAQLLVCPGRSGGPGAGLYLVQDEQGVVLVDELLHGLQELRPHVVVAALALNRLGDERGDVVRVAD